VPTDVFKTRKGEPDVAIIGVGIADEAGVPVERAAQTMRELQDDDGKPLSGKQLLDAAKQYADRNGLLVGKGPAREDEPSAQPSDAPPAPDTKES
jgi:hypothetical protein